MSNYWSNDDDRKVSYNAQPYQRTPRANGAARTADPGKPAGQADGGALSYSQHIDKRGDAKAGDLYQSPPQYGGDRSSFISGDTSRQNPGEDQYRHAPQFKFIGEPLDGGYQVRSEQAPPQSGGRRGGFWLKFLIVFLVLVLIVGGAYAFRYDILKLAGNIFGEETVWKFIPTPAPVETVSDEPAYVNAAMPAIKTQADREIGAVIGGLALDTYAVTDQNIVLRNEDPNGTYEYYLFASDTGRLLGYYEGLLDFIPCAKNLFYIAEEPWLITSRGFPLLDLEALQRSAGGAVTVSPMINGWAMVRDARETTLNFAGEDGKLISNLWFVKAFPFTCDTTIAYVDTGNVTAADNRYALYLLYRNGETKRLRYVPDTEGILTSVCGMAFTKDGEMHMQDEDLTLLTTTDQATAYVNCGALSVRDPDTGLYGLYVEGVQQYPFAFDSIEPMPSDLVWEAVETGYVTRCAVANRSYPLPRSYSFVLRKGGTEQVISIAAVSAYPILFN